MLIETRICPTCATDFQTSKIGQVYCRRTVPPNVGKEKSCIWLLCCMWQRIYQKKEKQKECSKRCMFLAKIASVNLERPQSPPEEEPRSFASYHKDIELFAQRMSYTLNGITWWATPCCYCGDPMEAEEHVFPLSAFKKLQAAGKLLYS